MGELEKDGDKKLLSFAEGGNIKLDSLGEMSYDDLEVLCNQLLQWKLFVANREFVGEAIGQYMTSSLN